MTFAIETQATINLVRDDDWKYSINAEIPLFGNREIKFITWNKKQGPPPTEGTDVLATLDPYRRSPYYIKKGELLEGDVDGTEPQKYMLDWNMTAAKPFVSDEPTQTTTGPNKTALSSFQKGLAPTVDANERYKIDKMGWNDRSGLEFAIQFTNIVGEQNVYAEEELLKIADRFAAWLNDRLLKRLHGPEESESDRLFNELDSPLVEKAVELGAEVVKVSKVDTPDVKTVEELQNFVRDRGWKKDDITDVLNAAGFADSKAFLASKGNTVKGLAELLEGKLN